MDFASLKDQVSNLTLYDLKAGVRKVQNGALLLSDVVTAANSETAVMNYTEMEAKVREATNNEPWGASSAIGPNYSLTILRCFFDAHAGDRQWYPQLVCASYCIAPPRTLTDPANS